MSGPTVPELRARAKALGIKGYSKMKKDELITAMAEAERLQLLAESEEYWGTLERDNNVVETVSLSQGAVVPERVTQLLGEKMVKALNRIGPMTNERRLDIYQKLGKALTPAQQRRLRKKANHILAVIRKGLRP